MGESDNEVQAIFTADTSDFNSGVQEATKSLGMFSEAGGAKLGQSLNLVGMRMLSHEMLQQVGLGGQMRMIFPLVRMAEEGMTTATMAWGGALATVTLGATLLIPAIIMLLEHRKAMKDQTDELVKALGAERDKLIGTTDATEEETKAQVALYNAKLLAAQLSLPEHIKALEADKAKLEEHAKWLKENADIQLIEMSGTKASSNAWQAHKEHVAENSAAIAALNLQEVALNKIMNERAITMDQVKLKEGEASKWEMERAKLVEEEKTIYQRDSTDKIQQIKEQSMAQIAAVKAEEASDKDRLLKKQMYQNQIEKIIIESNKKIKTAEDETNKQTVKGWTATSSIIGKAIGDSAMGATDAWKEAGKKITDNLIDVWEQQLEAYAAVQLGIMNIPGAALAIGEVGALEGIKAVVAHMATGGIVDRPTLALIGESGPEKVTPLTGDNAGGNLSVAEFHVHLPNVHNASEFKSQSTARELIGTLGDLYRRTGQKGRNF